MARFLYARHWNNYLKLKVMKNTTLMTKGLILFFFLTFYTIRARSTIFNNTSAITVNDGAAASPYSSNINVTGMSGTISSLTVKLNNVSHDYIQDMSVIIQAPNGKSMLLQSGAADGYAVSNITYTFSDAAISQFSATAQLVSGLYKPTGYFWDIFPSPAPLTPPGTNTYNVPGPFNAGLPLSTLASCFNGLAPNGTWKLWVADFSAGGDPGVISGGWTLNITTTAAPPSNTLNLKLYIQGFYNGGGFMKPVLSNSGVSGSTSTMTDSITVRLRNTAPPYAIVATLKTILNTNGTATCLFSNTGSYYIAITHRNALETWSATAVNIGTTPITYDFSNAANKAYGNNQISLGSGVFGFYSGDLNSDKNIDILDLNLIENDIDNFIFGYIKSDIDGDGNTDILDMTSPESHVNNFVASIHP